MIKVPVTMLVEQEIVRTLGTILFYNVWIYTRFVLFYVCLMVFNATFNNISVISWRSVLLVEETGGTGEKNRPVASHWQILSHIVVHLALIEFRPRNWLSVFIFWREFISCYVFSCPVRTHVRTMFCSLPGKGVILYITVYKCTSI
jgi:hypothetical protein